MEEEEVLESSNISNIHDISLPFICAIGFIQRLMMTSSDKNLPKTQVRDTLSLSV